MAPIAYTDGYITVATINLSARCTKLEVSDGYNKIDLKAFSNTAGNTGVGLKAQSIKATFLQDFAAGSTHATLQAALGTAIAIEARPTSGAASATNPKWTGTLLLAEYMPIGASVGEKQEVSVEFLTQGTAIVYATS
jgi:hypothetical protein